VLGQTFLANNVPDPRIDSAGNQAVSLRRLLAGFKAKDSNDNHQKAIPVSVIKQVAKLYLHSVDPHSNAAAQLIIGAFFFTMRSCEYSRTTSPQESKTTCILTVGNIRFFHNNTEVDHSDNQLTNADIVSITFVSQKNKEKFLTISMHKSGHPFLGPVIAWASVVQRIRSHPSATDNSLVNTFISSRGQLLHLMSSQIRVLLRAAAASLGEKTLGFQIKDIGCHSLRSGSAMAMYLANVPTTTIQLIGRWKSTAFMRYIREQVDCFMSNVSQKMISIPSFYTIPDPGTKLSHMCSKENGLWQSSAVFPQLVVLGCA